MNRNRTFTLISLLAAGSLIFSACAIIPASAADPTRINDPTETPGCSSCPAVQEPLTEKDAGKTIRLNVGDTLVVTLEGNLTTGFTWEMASTEKSLVTLAGEPEYKADSDQLGSPGKITLNFKVVSPGQQALKLVYRQPFDKTTPPEKTFEVTLTVTGEGGAQSGISTAVATAQPDPTSQATPATVVYPANGWKGWQTYTNASYGFTFQYPPEWKLEETRNTAKSPNTLNGHAVWLVPYTDNDVVLQIAFKRSTEDIPIQRTGLGSGDLIPWGKVLFLGAEIQRNVLVAQEKHVTVMYTGPGTIQRGELVFTLNLDYLGTDRQAGLTDGVEANADAIAASFQLTSGQ